MKAQRANGYYWHRFTWHPSGWRASL